MTTSNKELTSEELKSYLDYSPVTGLFTRFNSPDKEVGFVNQIGYRVISVKNRQYLAHRLAWLFMNETYPLKGIDHIDGNRSNNTWVNLREADQSQNLMNVGMLSNNTSGHKGVRWYPRYQKWHAQSEFKGKKHHLGYFELEQDAVEAYETFKKSVAGGFYRQVK